MSFPSNPSVGDSYVHPELGSTFIWYGPATGWQRTVTSAVMDYTPRDLSLDDVRTDAGDTTLSYTDGQLTSVVRPGVSKTLTYNPDGTLNTLTLVTDSETIVKTFGYGSDGLVTITVT